MNLCFTYESQDTLSTVKATAKLNLGHRNKFENEFQKFSRRSLRSSDAEFGNFTLLFCRGRQRNVPRIKTRGHTHCIAHQISFLATFSVALVILNSLLRN